MPARCTCPNGHACELPSTALPADGQPVVCPVCGAACEGTAQLLNHPGVIEDEWPPLPRPVPPEVADHAAQLTVLPVIPDYEILVEIGRGGMGVVYKARHLPTGHVVALKIIHGALLRHPQAVRRFRREARAAAGLTHPHLVAVHDAGVADSIPYLVMDCVEGIDLARLVARRGLLPALEACSHVRQACLGLQYIHEAGLVHRDLKPSNLMLTDEGQVKILDLGLARLGRVTEEPSSGDSLTPEGLMLGTPDYLAPEQALDAHAADIRADVYSLGCTLYHLLAGQPPFPGGTLAQKLLRHQQEEPAALEALRPDLPQGLGSVVRRLMARRPEARYQTPVEAAAALVPFCGAGQSGAVSPAPTRKVRRRVILPAVGVGVAGLGVGLLLWMTTGSRAPPTPPALLPKIENGIGMRLVLIAADTFQMGDDLSQPDNEKPRHEVTLTRAYYMGVCEVTQAQYRQIMGSNPSYFAATGDGRDIVRGKDTDRYPVEKVSWHYAQEFCRRLTQREGNGEYRLPTEAEWEYGCRGKTSTDYWSGKGADSLQGVANLADRELKAGDPEFAKNLRCVPWSDGYVRVAPVGSYRANPFGLHDMHGNVAEWCLDGYDREYYSRSRPRDPLGPPENPQKVVRGGSWRDEDWECRSASRWYAAPGDTDAYLGFRVVFVPAAPAS